MNYVQKVWITGGIFGVALAFIFFGLSIWNAVGYEESYGVFTISEKYAFTGLLCAAFVAVLSIACGIIHTYFKDHGKW